MDLVFFTVMALCMAIGGARAGTVQRRKHNQAIMDQYLKQQQQQTQQQQVDQDYNKAKDAILTLLRDPNIPAEDKAKSTEIFLRTYGSL